MAIKFGDSLENQNVNYPIVDLVANHAKGVLYVDAFTNANLAAIPKAKRSQGSVVIIKPTGLAYVFTGSGDELNDTTDDPAGTWNSTTANLWVVLGEAKQTANLPVQIPSGRSFGKYVNGDVITVASGGWNALEIIRDAITGFIQPTVTGTGSAGSAAYSLSVQNSQSHNVSFTVKNNNQSAVSSGSNGFKIKDIKIYRRYATTAGTIISDFPTLVATIDGSSSGANLTAFNNLNTVLSSGVQPTAQTFQISESLNIEAATTATTKNYYYAVVATPFNSAGTEVAASGTAVVIGSSLSLFYNVADYSAPTASIAITATNSPNLDSYVSNTGGVNGSSATNRMVGDYKSSVTFTVTNNNSLVPLTTYSIARSIDGTAANVVINQAVPTPSGSTYTITYNDNALDASSTYGTIAYTITVSSAYGNTAPSLSDNTISYNYPAFVGVLGKDNKPTSAAITAGVQALTGVNNVALTSAEVVGLSARRLFSTGANVHKITGPTTGGITISTSANQFVFACIPVTHGPSSTATAEITNINLQNQANSITSWNTSDPTHTNTNVIADAYESDTINVTLPTGHQRPYYVYRTNSNNPYSTAVTLFINDNA